MSKTSKPTISQHFVNLGAPLRNVLNSWGAVSADGAVILRVWADERRQFGSRWFRVLANPAWNTSVGYPERLSHIDSIRAGSKGYMVVLTAVDPKAQPRKIGHFNPDVFIPIGEVLTTPDGVVWGECLPTVDAIRPGA